MRKSYVSMLCFLLILSCSHQKTFQEQLNANFAYHLKKIDSLAGLDSVQVLWKASATQKLGTVIDDSVYMREYVRIQGQLQKALQKNEKDSVEFFKYEINYMKEEIDSVSRSIAIADTTRKFGYLIGCAYFITKNQKTKIDSTIIYIGANSSLRYTEFMDSSIKRTLNSMN